MYRSDLLGVARALVLNVDIVGAGDEKGGPVRLAESTHHGASEDGADLRRQAEGGDKCQSWKQRKMPEEGQGVRRAREAGGRKYGSKKNCR